MVERAAPCWRRLTWPPMARGAPTLTHGGPLRSRAEPRPFGPRSAAPEPLLGANNSLTTALSSRPLAMQAGHSR